MAFNRNFEVSWRGQKVYRNTFKRNAWFDYAHYRDSAELFKKKCSQISLLIPSVIA